MLYNNYNYNNDLSIIGTRGIIIYIMNKEKKGKKKGPGGSKKGVQGVHTFCAAFWGYPLSSWALNAGSGPWGLIKINTTKL